MPLMHGKIQGNLDLEDEFHGFFLDFIFFLPFSRIIP